LKIQISGDTAKKGKGEEKMIQVRVFDHEHEKDLEKDMNRFLKQINDDQLVDIKYNVAAMAEEEDDEEQIYCFSAMVIYKA
jgi:hypothetical protein